MPTITKSNQVKGKTPIRKAVANMQATYKVPKKLEVDIAHGTEEISMNIPVTNEIDPDVRVGASVGYTVNVGNYESIRIDVTANIPTTLNAYIDGSAYQELFSRLTELAATYRDKILTSFNESEAAPRT